MRKYSIYMPFKAVCLNHFLCPFSWPGGYLIKADTGIQCWSSPQATVDGETSNIPVKLSTVAASPLLFFHFCDATRGESWRSENQRPLKSPLSCKLGSFAIDKSPQSCIEAVGKRGGIVVCFPAAFISVNIRTVQQNARNDNQKPNKVKWAHKFPQAQCVHYPKVWSRLWLGHNFF